MPGKRRKSPPEHPIERLLRAVSTIGQLEIIAGIDRSPEGRKPSGMTTNISIRQEPVSMPAVRNFAAEPDRGQGSSRPFLA
jgi:hypothetical protein